MPFDQFYAEGTVTRYTEAFGNDLSAYMGTYALELNHFRLTRLIVPTISDQKHTLIRYDHSMFGHSSSV